MLAVFKGILITFLDFFLCHVWRKNAKLRQQKKCWIIYFICGSFCSCDTEDWVKKQFHGFLIRKVTTFSEWICTSEEILNIVLLHTDILILKRVELVEN